MLGYLSADNICSEKRTVFRERSSRKTVSFEEQIVSKDKYPRIFSQPNWGYCVYYPSVLRIGEYPRIFPSFSWGIFAHETPLDQSHASENIWWIINIDIFVYCNARILMKWAQLLNYYYYDLFEEIQCWSYRLYYVSSVHHFWFLKYAKKNKISSSRVVLNL